MSRILKTLPWPVIALILGFLCPTELSLYLGGLRLPPYRIILLVVVPIALWKLCFAGQGTRLKAFDYFFFAFGAWIVFSFSMHPGDAGGIEAGGSQALDCIGGYLIARVYIRTISQFVAALKLLSGAVIGSGLIALPELFTGRHFAHEIMRAITGIHVQTDMGQRFGLTRAYGTFDHPIHLGTFSCALFAVFWYAASTWTGRLVRGGLVAVATLTAISSASIPGLLLQCGLIVWDMATRAIKGRVVLTIGAVVLALLTVSALSSRSVFRLIATYPMDGLLPAADLGERDRECHGASVDRHRACGLAETHLDGLQFDRCLLARHRNTERRAGDRAPRHGDRTSWLRRRARLAPPSRHDPQALRQSVVHLAHGNGPGRMHGPLLERAGMLLLFPQPCRLDRGPGADETTGCGRRPGSHNERPPSQEEPQAAGRCPRGPAASLRPAKWTAADLPPFPQSTR